MRLPTQTSLHKMWYVQLLVVVGLGIIVVRLYDLQIYRYHIFSKRGEKNFLRTVQVPCLRGDITDTHGSLLVTNIPVYTVWWYGSCMSKLTQEHEKYIQTLASILGLSQDQQILLHKKISKAERFGRHIQLYEGLDLDTVTQISEQCSRQNNIVITAESKRSYPHANLACHVLGYLGDVRMQGQGKMGLEKIGQAVLQGQEGTMQVVMNSFGRHLTMEKIKHEQHGKTLQTTLDLDLQIMAEQAFDQQAGVLLVFDPYTGAIRSLVSRPGFDPSLFLQPLSHQVWNDLSDQNKPFLNRAFSAMYPPASIFKLITLCAALDTHIIDPDIMTYCKGYTTFCKRRYHCAKRAGHGWVSIADSLAHSCNILFYDIAKQISIDTLAQYAYMFGLGRETSVLGGDKSGLVPSSEWKMAVKGERWWRGETLSAVIGQSFLLVTPIQVACMIGGLFTGKVMRPRLLETEPIAYEDVPISQDIRETLQGYMESVVTLGTGRRLRKSLQELKLYAKSGTAQTRSLRNRRSKYEHKEHAWFVCHFQYQDQQPLVLVSLVEHAGGSRYAANITKQFLQQYVQYCKMQDQKKESY